MPLQNDNRTENLAMAGAALTQAVTELSSKFGLTTAEVCVALSEVQGRWAKYQLRDERESHCPEGKT